MATRVSATPLIAIEAVVVDTETTSLDTAKARVVQIGAVRIRKGKVDEAHAFDTLVDPLEPIPAASTRIHGISNADARFARPFEEVHPEFAAFVGRDVVVGHSVGFDLAVWRAELKRIGQGFEVPRVLDTRLLAQIANPRLPGFSLEIVAAWLGVEGKDRHNALGDAIMTGKCFLAMIPHLRDKEIRTVAEAEAACRRLSDALEEHYKAGWVEPVRTPPTERSLARIDSYPYRHRVRDAMASPPFVADERLTVAEAAQLMAARKISSLFLAPAPIAEAPPVAAVGIVTERDVLRAVAARGAAALSEPVTAILSRPVASVPAEAYIYRAFGRMSRKRIRHLAVEDERGRLIGALSQRDLLKLRAEEAISLGDEIDSAEDEAELAAAWAKLPAVAASLVAEGVPPHDVAGVVSRELGALTRRAGVVAEARMIAEGEGAAPVPYALLILGSGGRGESLLSADQDNAVVFASGDPDGPEDRWFAAFGDKLAAILNAAGLPFCKGGVMARNPPWRGSLATWRTRIEGWVRRSRPQDLLAVDIFFDMRHVHGDAEIAAELLDVAYDLGAEAGAFAKLLAEAAGEHKPPLTFLGGIRTEDGRVDLKAGALLPIVSTARVLAIRHHVVHRATADRIAGVKALDVGGDRDLEHMLADHRLVLGLVLAQQLVDVEHGVPPSARVVVKSLSRDDADRLKAALSRIGGLGELTRSVLFG